MIVSSPDLIRRLADSGAKPLWIPNPKQAEALMRREFEVNFGGTRGSGKTAAGIIWLIIGNPDVPEDKRTPVDWSYINHPSYRALVLRKNQVDLADWVRKARDVYTRIGASFRERPAEFVWPNPANPSEPGATIVIGHLADADAYEKYQGQEFQRILLEEATQIPSYDLYARVIASCRSVHPELRPQVFLTCNPGGPGHHWVKSRFVTPVGRDGKLIPPGRTIDWDPERGDLVKLGATRIFIPALPGDNRAMVERDPLYVSRMAATLAPHMRRAWIEGDWTSVGGEFFSEFRVKPLVGEPPEACHVVEPVELAPWWPRWAACDWGYAHEAACYVACRHPSGKIHVCRELVAERLTPEEFGTEIAHMLRADLEAMDDPCILLYSPHDTFARRTEEKTIADQMASGIAAVYGPDSVVVNHEGRDFFEIRRFQKRARVVVQRVQKLNASGWQYVRSLLRWWPLVGEQRAAFDPAYALELFHRYGVERYAEYVREMRRPPEALPKLQIWSSCARLIDAIPRMMCQDPERGDPENMDPTHVRGRDSVDAWGYLCLAYREQQSSEPFRAFFRRRMEPVLALHGSDGNAVVWAARKAEADWKRLSGGPLRIARIRRHA